MNRVGLLVGCLTALVAAAARAEDPPQTEAAVSFYRDIRPLFQAHCYGCHQPAKQGGDYEMTVFAQLLKGGESGEAAITPGDPETSYLLDQVRAVDGQAEMPKDRPPLSAEQVALVERWIRGGANDDTPASARQQFDAAHPPRYEALPIINSLDFSPDGQWLAVSGYHEVVLHRSDGSGVVARLVGMSERIESAVFSPDSRRLAVTGGSPGRMGEVQIWDVASARLLLSRPVGYDTCYGAAWSGDGKLVSFGCPDNTIRAIDTATGEQVLFNGAHNDWVLDTVFSAKSDHLVSVSRDRSMKLVHVPTERFIDNITSITPGALKGGLSEVDRHPTKDELLCGGADGVPKIYRMVREKARKIGDDFNLIRAFPAMPGRIFSLAFSADGNRIVVGSSHNGRGEVRVYQVADGKILMKLEVPEGGIYAVDFSADGETVAAGGYDGMVRLIAVADGAVRKMFPPIDLSAAAE